MSGTDKQHKDSSKPVPQEFRALEEKIINYAEGITGGGWLWVRLFLLITTSH
jgi:hypothetical protein